MAAAAITIISGSFFFLSFPAGLSGAGGSRPPCLVGTGRAVLLFLGPFFFFVVVDGFIQQ